MDEKRIQLYRSALHPFFSISIPFFFIFTADRLLKAILSASFPIVTPFGFSAVVLAVGVGEAVSANFLFRERVGDVYSRVRELALFLIGSFLAMEILSGAPFRGDFNPLKIEVLYPLALAVLQWILSFQIHRGLKEREVYLSLLIEKKGSKLKTAVRDFNAEAVRSQKAIVRAKRILLFFQAFVFVQLLIVSATIGIAQGSLVILALAHAGFGILCLAMLNGLLEEESLLTDGFTIQARLIRRRYAVFIFLFLLGTIIAVLLLGKGSLVPDQYLWDFLGRIAAFLTPKPRYARPRLKSPEEVKTETPQFNAAPQSPISAAAAGPSVAAAIFRIAGICILVILGLLFLYFLIRPFLSRNARERLREIHPLRSLARVLLSIFALVRAAFVRLLAWLKSPKKGLRKAARAFVKALGETAIFTRETGRRKAHDAGRFKRHEVNRFIKGFLRIIRWGERCGVGFRTTIGPMDYMRLLCKAMPEREGLFMEAGAMFEEIVFSRHRIETGQASRYFDTVHAIVRTRSRVAAAAAP